MKTKNSTLKDLFLIYHLNQNESLEKKHLKKTMERFCESEHCTHAMFVNKVSKVLIFRHS